MSKEKISTEGDFDSETGSDTSWSKHQREIMEEFDIDLDKL